MSAVGVLEQLYVAQIRHPLYLSQPRQNLWRDAVVDGQDHHGIGTRRVSADLHARDVHVVLAENAADLAHDARTIFVAADQKTALGYQVHAKRIDSHRTRLSHQQGARDLVVHHAESDQAGIAAVRTAASLDQADPAIGGYQTRVDRVDALLGEWLD